MCGIAGIVGEHELPRAERWQRVARMAECLQHRGPDDSGQWSDEGGQVVLAHRRLSILDLSPAGHQPMLSPSGRYAIVLNGEIYNHLQLRDRLPDVRWRGTSDTESLLAALDRWGLAGTLPLIAGMYALALWDRQEQQLHLVRDRLGEKPLYYREGRHGLVFASELKAFGVLPETTAQVDLAALGDLLSLGYVRAPRSILEGILKLPPASVLTWQAASGTTRIETYWSLASVAANGAREPFAGDESAALGRLDELLDHVVRDQCRADVPLGALLSGGIDSSLVVSTMSRYAHGRLRTFSIGFADEAYNEAPVARAVADALGTEHTEWILSAGDALRIIPDLARIYDEPLGDSSQIPTVLVSRLAREHVTVALSGDGGDEIFGGYPHYRTVPRLWRQLHGGRPVGRWVGAGLRLLSRDALDGALGRLLSLRGRPPGWPPSARLRAIAEGLEGNSPLDLWHSLARRWGPPGPPLARAVGASPGAAGMPASVDDAGMLMLDDAGAYLPDDILVKVDRAAMSVGLETRAPLLDHRIVEFAWTLPPGFKIRDGEGKWLLRQAVRRRLPEAVATRPKQGFVLPVAEWLRQAPLRDWAEDLLGAGHLNDIGLFDTARIRRCWQQHLEGRYLWHGELWPLLMFLDWHRARSVRPVTAPAKISGASGG